jgi:hypothetical protein
MDMEKKIEKRMAKLKVLGAGDKNCEECLDIQAARGRLDGLSICRKCISDTPAFTELVNRLMANTVVTEVTE